LFLEDQNQKYFLEGKRPASLQWSRSIEGGSAN
jgi:hypothetical protein